METKNQFKCDLQNGDCLELMKNIQDKSVDLIFCDLPYGQTSCKWDCCIDLEKFWIQVMRIKKLNAPIFMTTTTKFGVSLINSAPKKCPFRYDIVWMKSAPAGFLLAKKMPLRKHEMIYVFYEKLPFYDLSSHQHKFIKDGSKSKEDNCYGIQKLEVKKQYNPPLPVSIVKEERREEKQKENSCYGGLPKTGKSKEAHSAQYDPPLPVSIIKPDIYGNPNRDIEDYKKCGKKGKNQVLYDPPLPVSVVKEGEFKEDPNHKPDLYGVMSGNAGRNKGFHQTQYDPPLPVSVVKEEKYERKNSLYPNRSKNGETAKSYDPPLPVSIVKEENNLYDGGTYKKEDNADFQYRKLGRKQGESAYDPPLPNSMLEIRSTRGKHSTEKPVALMEWVFKYYSKEGDTIFDPTMGSGSTGVACKNMNRNFIGYEMDEVIFKVAQDRCLT